MGSPGSLAELNACTPESCAAFVEGSVCRSRKFARLLAARRPFEGAGALLAAARELWTRECGPVDWLQAVGGHPRLGDRMGAGKRKVEGQEQRAVLETMDERTAAALLELNDKYEERFGHTFLLCAPGVPAHVVEESMRSRMGNSHTHELLIAASEQAKITEGRLTKMLDLQTATETGAPPEDARAAATARVHQARRHARRRDGGGPPLFERTPRARSASDGRGRRLTAPAPRPSVPPPNRSGST